MKKSNWFLQIVVVVGLLGIGNISLSQVLEIDKNSGPGNAKPIWVSLSGITGEALQVLQFDLYVQGFNFTNAESAQYLISGSNNGNFEGRATDRFNKSNIVSKAYSGATLRRQVHKFVDDFTSAIQRKAIAQTQIAFKGVIGAGHSEIFISDFD